MHAGLNPTSRPSPAPPTAPSKERILPMQRFRPQRNALRLAESGPSLSRYGKPISSFRTLRTHSPSRAMVTAHEGVGLAAMRSLRVAT
jgi:hypothetical protein